jgi:hypothetical protein
MDYFGDNEKLPDGCGACDNCQETETFEISEELKKDIRIVLSGLARFGAATFGKGVLVDCLLGKTSERGQSYRHDQLSTYGLLALQAPAGIDGLGRSPDPPGLHPAEWFQVSDDFADGRRRRRHERPEGSGPAQAPL